MEAGGADGTLASCTKMSSFHLCIGVPNESPCHSAAWCARVGLQLLNLCVGGRSALDQIPVQGLRPSLQCCTWVSTSVRTCVAVLPLSCAVKPALVLLDGKEHEVG